MWQFIQKYINAVQQSDNNTKKSWVAGCTIVTMIFVISLWSLYFQDSVQTLNLPETPTPITQEASILSTFTIGGKIVAKKIGSAISNGIAEIKSLTKETRSVTLQTANINFVLEELPVISPKSLPH
ncbi:MAG TPA: hypothetical protein VJH70_02890 [Candidatus Paceibacterota bacterium]